MTTGAAAGTRAGRPGVAIATWSICHQSACAGDTFQLTPATRHLSLMCKSNGCRQLNADPSQTRCWRCTLRHQAGV